MTDEIHIYTDGSSLGNPGPGGYAAVLKFNNLKKEIAGGFRKTTNNRMELLAVIEAIKTLNDKAKDKKIVVFTDSKYVKDAIDKGWVYNWQKKNYKDKANADLWRKFLKLYPKYTIEFQWVKGHSGVPENERCDILAKKAASQDNLPADKEYENLTKGATLL